MTSKKPHPIFSKVKKPQSAKPRHKKWLVAILLLPILVIGYLFWSQPSSDTTVTPMVAPPSLDQQNAAARSADPSAEGTIIETDTSGDNYDDKVIEGSINDNITDGNLSADRASTTDKKSKIVIPSSKAIIDAPLPETNTLAKEEIDRLADERQRLNEQESIDTEQVEMTKSLTEMKAQRIELLEQQIAELEAQQAAQ